MDPSPHTIAGLYFAAANAVEQCLPAASRALIEEQDRLHREWRSAGFADDRLPALHAARVATDADPLARVAMDLRRTGNTHWFADREAAKRALPPTA